MIDTLIFFWIFVQFVLNQNHFENYNEPYFTHPIENVTVSVGKEAILVCEVNNLNHYKVGWIRAEDHTVLSLQDRVITHNHRITVQNENNGIWKLKIRYLKESDKGCYMCQINTNVMKKQIGCIDVFVPPSILDNETSSDIIVREGANITLKCQASGNPTPRIQWRREDGLPFKVFNITQFQESIIFNQSMLNFINATRQIFGAYFCIANNDVPPAVSKRVVINVNYIPKITVANDIIGAPQGSTIMIECTIEGYPIPKAVWRKKHSKVLINNKNKYNQTETRIAFKTKFQLTIHNVDSTDLGTYECIASNKIGSSRALIVLYEIKVETTTTTMIQNNYNLSSLWLLSSTLPSLLSEFITPTTAETMRTVIRNLSSIKSTSTNYDENIHQNHKNLFRTTTMTDDSITTKMYSKTGKRVNDLDYFNNRRTSSKDRNGKSVATKTLQAYSTQFIQEIHNSSFAKTMHSYHSIMVNNSIFILFMLMLTLFFMH